LLFDGDGIRMVPSHANKAGRRYRYYLSKALKEESADAVDGWRLPARMIEEVVLNEVHNLLCNSACLIEFLCLTGPRLKAMLSEASRLGDRIRKVGPAEQRGVLLETVARIEVRQDRVRIVLHADALREMIGQGKTDRAPEQDTSEFTLDVPVSFRRRGVEMKLVIADNRAPLLAPDPKLIAVVAQGRQWFADIREGKVGSIAELALQCGVYRTDVGRMIPLAFLAPDIVEAILDGRQPVELTAARLKRVRDLPVSWDDQRRLLGFAR
jgi:site-specific DNA recombinase